MILLFNFKLFGSFLRKNLNVKTWNYISYLYTKMLKFNKKVKFILKEFRGIKKKKTYKYFYLLISFMKWF